jgi:hypothetical protein
MSGPASRGVHHPDLEPGFAVNSAGSMRMSLILLYYYFSAESSFAGEIPAAARMQTIGITGRR